MQVRSLGWEDPLEEEMATHSSILAWKIPQAEEPGGLQSMGLQSWTRLSFYNQKRNGKAKKKFKLTGVGWKKQNIVQVSKHMKWGRKLTITKKGTRWVEDGRNKTNYVSKCRQTEFHYQKAENQILFKKSICKLSVKISMLNKRTKILKMKGWEKIHWKDSNKEEEVWYTRVK